MKIENKPTLEMTQEMGPFDNNESNYLKLELANATRDWIDQGHEMWEMNSEGEIVPNTRFEEEMAEAYWDAVRVIYMNRSERVWRFGDRVMILGKHLAVIVGLAAQDEVGVYYRVVLEMDKETIQTHYAVEMTLP